MDSFFSSVGELVFFSSIQDYLDHEAGYLLKQILDNVYSMVFGIAATLMTIWILVKGYSIMSGQSRESLAGFMLSAGKTVAILTVAGVVAGGSTTLYTNLTNGLEETITGLVTGKPSATAYTEIDDNLKLMQTGLGMMKAIDTGDNEAVESERTQALWMSGIGTAGPAIVAGTLLIINKFGMAIFIGFGPLFIMCLLFDQTKAMFQTWLKFGIGLMFSMAILVFMSNIAMRMVGALAATAFAQDFLDLGGTGFTAAAMQQGGLGLVLTALLVTVPAMV